MDGGTRIGASARPAGSAEPAQILFVCTANVCRSRFAAAYLAAGSPTALRVRSAGVDAYPGEPMCAQAAARLPARPAATISTEPTDAEPADAVPAQTGARLLSADDLRSADLVLALDRSHRSACARLLPACRPRLFTLPQAAALADHLGASLATGQRPPTSPPLPDDAPARVRWLVAEFDAARGALAGSSATDAEILDRHGPRPHPEVFDEITAAVDALRRCLAALLAS